MLKYFLIACGLSLVMGCSEKKQQQSSSITIVDIGHLDRVELAKELQIIKKYSPRVIGLDFLLVIDSLDKDIALAEELSKTKNIVQITKLHNNDPFDITKWDNLEQYHPKFRYGVQGFSNLTITEDSVIVPELPMRQYYRDDVEFAFSYMVAIQYNFQKVNPKYKDGDADFSFRRSVFSHDFKVISVKDLLSENFKKDDITDKIVLMGFVAGNEDSFYADSDRKRRIRGVEFHACIIRALFD